MAYSSITKPSLHFNTKLYTGNGGTNAITGVGFQPDLVWIKDRDATGYHFWTDAVRGVTKTLFSNTTGAEGTEVNGLTAFGTDGFTVGAHSNINTNGRNIVSWNWKAGGSAVTNNVGDLTSSVSCNNAAGISIITWTGDGSGATVGTGFTGTETIGFATVKKLSTTSEWQTGVYGAYASNARNFAYHLELNSTSALSGSSPYMLGTQTSGDPTKLKLASEGYVNSVTYVAYVFKPVKGYSKFGIYTGNGNADGPFVYTGFKPAFVIIKPSSYSNSWGIFDNKRPGYNVTKNRLEADNTSAENTALDYFDFLSNGFKVRTSNGHPNTNGGTLVYMAFAEEPLVANVGAGVPATAG
jgi:hypothetical protein